MTIAFFTNFISHHQVHVADELYKLTNGNYTFVELMPMPETFKKSGYADYSSRSYVLQAWKDETSREKALALSCSVDVMLVGGYVALEYEKKRCKETDKLTIEISERLLKKGLINLLSPSFLKWYIQYITLFRKKNVYKLCCSSFTPYDMNLIGAFKNKCYKWAYFTEVDYDWNISDKMFTGRSIMWVSRYIPWKHPELPIKLAKRLYDEGIDFKLDMYGGGVLKETLLQLIRDLHVETVVTIHDNKPNHEILNELRKHDIVLATSDKNEGWGAVVNEAMSNGCVIVGSNVTGAIPYLIKDGVNGYIFESENLDSLYNKVKNVIGNESKCKSIATAAYYTMRDVWSPQKASEKLIVFIQNLLSGCNDDIRYGPCSPAPIIRLK